MRILDEFLSFLCTSEFFSQLIPFLFAHQSPSFSVPVCCVPFILYFYIIVIRCFTHSFLLFSLHLSSIYFFRFLPKNQIIYDSLSVLFVTFFTECVFNLEAHVSALMLMCVLLTTLRCVRTCTAVKSGTSGAVVNFLDGSRFHVISVRRFRIVTKSAC